MKTLQQHRARPQRWLATLTIALLALGAPLATAAPAFATAAAPGIEQPAEQPAEQTADQPSEQPAEQAPAEEAAPADAPTTEEIVSDEPAADAPQDAVAPAPEAAPPAEEAPAPAPLVADVAALAVTVDSASEEAGLSVRVLGSGFGATTGAYGALIEKGTEAAVGASGGYTAFGYWMTPGAIVDGAFDKSLVAATTALDRTKLYEVIVWQGHSAPNADTIYARADVAPTTDQWDALFPPAVAPTPTVSVSKTDGLNAAGETVTVTGTGFLPGEATSGARPPLSGKFAGSYVVFGRFADVWKPSESAPSASRAGSGDTKWAVPAADMAAIGGASAGAIELKPDGTFEATLSVSEEFAKNPGTGNYGIYTYSGSGAKAAQFETFTPITFAPKVVTPTVSVSKTDGLNAAGETVTVTGTGFLPGEGTTGARPPLSGKFAGSYVVFGRFADVWKPSESAPSASRAGSGDTKWAVPAADMAAIGGANAGAIELKADGTFEATLSVSEEFTKNPGTGNYGIYTYSGSGAKAAQFETFTPIAFAPKVVTPTITASVDAASAESGLGVRVVGSGFGATTSAYAAIIEKGTEGSVTADSGFIAMEYLRGGIVAGALDKTLVAPTAKLDRSKQYEVVIWKEHSLPNADTIFARAAVAPSDAQWNAVFPPVVAPSPSVVATVSSASEAAGLSVRLVGSSFGATTSAYAAIIEKGTESSVTAGSGFVAMEYWPGSIAGGAFDKTLVAPTAKLDRSKQYEILIWKQHSLPNADTIYARADIAPTSGQWDAVFPPVVAPAPSIATTVSSASAESGLTVRVVGSSFGTTTGAYAALIEKGTEANVDASGGYAAFGFWMTPGAIIGGSFDKTLVAPTTALGRGKQYEVIVWKGHTAPNADTIYARAALTPSDAQWNALFPTTPEPGAAATSTTLSVDKTAVVAGSTVTATAVIAPVAASGTVSFFSGVSVIAKDVAVKNGTATATVKLTAVGSASLTAVFTPAKPALFSGSTSAAVVVAVAAKPVTPPAVQKGELAWGVYGAFRDYVTGPIASGAITPIDGASAAGSAFLFAQAGGTVDLQAGKGTAEYTGGVRFTGHHGALDLALSAPKLRLDNASRATLSVAVNGARVDFATVNLAAAGTSTDKGTTFVVDAPVTLSAAGATAFQDFYPAGTLLDPISVAFSTGTTEPVETIGTRTGLVVDTSAVTVGATVTLNATVTPATAQGSVIFAANGEQIGAPVRLADGAASATAVLRTVGDVALTARFVPDTGFAASSSAASTVTVTSGVVPPVTPPVTPPTTPIVPPIVAPTVQGGSLSWGVSASFRDYLSKPATGGSITVAGGATSSGGAFQFGQSGGDFSQQSGTGTADYAGNVRFTGHGGILDLTFSNPSLSVAGASSAILSLSVNGSRVDFATVDLGAASRSTLNGATVFSGAPVTLTAAGSSAFQGYYPAGRALDPLTVTIGAAAAAPAGSTGTVSTASVRTPAASDIPATPPATTGITLAPAVLAGLMAGGQISFEVDGFQPNETGIRVVIYSTPTVLAENLTADANGVVRWSGTLPATLTGEHTLTVQGSISKGIVLTIPERTVAGSCAVSGATLDWGFKASFLAYISSGIAKGGWELSGGTTEADGLFHWADGSGSIDAETGSGLVNYSGGIRFTGHDGALDTTIANPRIELVSATEGYLVLDVTGTTQQGEPIAAQAVRFGSLALGDGSLQVTETGITGTDIAAELTDAGAAAFGTYPAGDALDPVSFTLPTADCAVVAEAVAAETGAGDTEATAISADTAEPGVDWVVWILAAALAAAVAVIVVLLVKRRRAGAGASAE